MFVYYSKSQKWKQSIFTSLAVGLGSYAYQDFATLKPQYELIFKDEINDFSTFYTNVCSIGLFLTAIAVIVLGILCDKFGAQICLFITQFMRVLLLFIQLYVVRFSHNPLLLFLSRVGIYVIAQTSGIMGNAHLSSILDTKELPLPIAIFGMLQVIGQGANLYYAESMYKEMGFLICMWFSLVINVFALFLVSANLWESMRNQKKINQEDMNMVHPSLDMSTYSLEELPRDGHYDGVNQNKNPYPYTNDLDNSEQMSLGQISQTGGEIINSIKKYGTNYWIVCIVLCIFQSLFNLNDMLGNLFVMDQWNYNALQAAQVESIFPFIALCLPLVGKILDKYIENIDFFLIICLFIAQLSLIFLLEIDPLNGFILFGISNAIRLAVFVPIISLVLNTPHLGLPIAIVKCLADVIGFFLGQGAGYVKAATGSYASIFWGLLGLTFIGFVLSIMLSLKMNKKDKGIQSKIFQ